MKNEFDKALELHFNEMLLKDLLYGDGSLTVDFDREILSPTLIGIQASHCFLEIAATLSSHGPCLFILTHCLISHRKSQEKISTQRESIL